MAGKYPEYVADCSDSADDSPFLRPRSSRFSVPSTPTSSQPLTPSLASSMKSFSIPTPSTPRTRQRKPFVLRKRKFSGNQYKIKSGEKFIKLDPVEVASVREVVRPPTDTIAARKLKFQEAKTSPRKMIIKVQLDVKSVEEVYPVRGKHNMDLEAFIDVLKDVAMCQACQIDKLELFDKGTQAGAAKYLMFRYSSCFETRSFWSVSGKWTKNIQVGEKMIPKRNDTVYASVLGGRIIGIGENKRRLYHGALNIPHPPIHSTFREIQNQSLSLLNMLPPEVWTEQKLN